MFEPSLGENRLIRGGCGEVNSRLGNAEAATEDSVGTGDWRLGGAGRGQGACSLGELWPHSKG